MAPKKKSSGAKKKKAPTIYTSEEDMTPFGFKLNDIIRTPLGIIGTVIGVKYDSPEAKESGRVWVKYENGHEAPLEPKLGAGFMTALGYRKASDADHIRRDVDVHGAELKAVEDERKIVAEVLRCKEAGIPIPEELIPVKKVKKAKEDKKKK